MSPARRPGVARLQRAAPSHPPATLLSLLPASRSLLAPPALRPAGGAVAVSTGQAQSRDRGVRRSAAPQCAPGIGGPPPAPRAELLFRASPSPAPAPRTDSGDWELWHQKGLCLTHLKSYDAAVQCLRAANEIQRHDVTFVALGKVYSLQENWGAAVEVYMDALDFSPENAEILTTIGLLHLQQGDTSKAFDFLGNSLTHDPKSAKTILAAGSIIQARGERGSDRSRETLWRCTIRPCSPSAACAMRRTTATWTWLW